MSVGQLFVVLAAVMFFLAGIGVNAIPNMVTWGLFALALGILTSGLPLWRPA